MEYLWIYIAKDLSSNVIMLGIVSAEHEEEAKERVYDRYNNHGVKVYEITLTKVKDYKGYDVDHNVLELTKTKLMNVSDWI